MSKIFCKQPFFYAEVNCWGDVQVCCDKWCKHYIIGNILENSFEEIWKGEKHLAFIKQFEEQKFEFCDLSICPLKTTYSDEEFEENYNRYINKRRKLLRINYDCSCNLTCIFCRDKALIDDEPQLDKMHQAMLKMLPMLNEQNFTLSINGVGEVFTSKRQMELIKEISKTYPDIKISIITNGVLASEEKIKSLGLEDRLEGVEVSVHAYDKKTYDKLARGGNFEQVKKNLQYISKLKKEGKIVDFFMNFAVNSENYKEMEKFAKWAIELGARPNFLPLVKLEPVSDERYKELNVADESHPKYNDFVRMLKNPFFKSDDIGISEWYFSLREKKEKNIFQKIFRL